MKIKDIEELSMHDPIVYAVWMNYKLKRLNKEEALIAMVLALSEQNKTLFEQVVKLEQTRTTMRVEESNFWDLYDRYQDKIAEKLQLKDEVERLKEALRKISVPMPGSRDNELVLYYERIAEEALKEDTE